MAPKLKIIKIGGNVIDAPDSLTRFLNDFASLPQPKILVHGGGKKASEMITQLGLEPKMRNGRRITDEYTLKIVTMVYAGLINKNMVAELQKYACNAIGLSGADANSILAHKRIVKEVDYGFAGDVDAVNAKMIKTLIDAGTVPVFCAITHDKKGQLLNTNADTIAAELAKALVMHFDVELTYCFEVAGVLSDINDENSLIEKIDLHSFIELKKTGVISWGMLPKLDNCFDALQNGVRTVVIGKPEVISNSQVKHTTLTL